MKNDSVKKVVATGVGAALFFVLARFVAIPSGIPNTNITFQYAAQAVFAVLYGPVVGCLSGFIGHVLTDMSWGGVWWSWAFATAVYGLIVGAFADKINVKDGDFLKKEGITFVLAVLLLRLVISSSIKSRLIWSSHRVWLPELVTSYLLSSLAVYCFTDIQRQLPSLVL